MLPPADSTSRRTTAVRPRAGRQIAWPFPGEAEQDYVLAIAVSLQAAPTGLIVCPRGVVCLHDLDSGELRALADPANINLAHRPGRLAAPPFHRRAGPVQGPGPLGGPAAALERLTSLGSCASRLSE